MGSYNVPCLRVSLDVMLVCLAVSVLKVFWDATLWKRGERRVKVKIFILSSAEKGPWWFRESLVCSA